MIYRAILLIGMLVPVYLGSPVNAEVRLPGFFTDHMVFQQQMPLRLWGWGDPGEAISIQFGDQKQQTVVSAGGEWEATLESENASAEPRSLVVKGENTIEIRDVLVGEVWLCSGQSNMEWVVRSSANADEEIAAANDSLIRHMKVAHRPSTTPLDDVESSWEVCTPETAGNFTACGYFMARRLRQELDVPVGLINSSWGGTRVEPWTSPGGFQGVEALQSIYQSILGRTPGTEAYTKKLREHLEATKQWVAMSSIAMKDEVAVSPNPSFPPSLVPFKSHQDPTMLYNGMIHAIVGFPIRGAIWYQGESNHADGMLYFEKKKALIQGWRELWQQGDFPFYYVQIAPFQYGSEQPGILPAFWEAQAAVKQLPNTGMVVINDIATLNNIHPPNKQDVGDRLALLALRNDYGKEVVAASPEMDSMQVDGAAIRVTFSDTGGGLKSRDGKPLTHFELVGVGSRGFKPAQAAIDGDSIVLTSEFVSQPTGFRFAWDKLAEPNLCGATGLPVGAFRGGETPPFVSGLGIETDYQLVYDLDLAKLGAEIRYDVDHSEDVNGFDRVAYLLELKSESAGEQNVFVSVAAFTDDVKQIGVPTVVSGGVFQESLREMEVISDVEGLFNGKEIATGNIEFWPNNYGPQNQAKVKGASGSRYDFGDQRAEPKEGYGSMQIHNHGAGQTVFALNHWGVGPGADIGIGNSSGENPDWTFSGNAKSYSKKRLRIYVRPKP